MTLAWLGIVGIFALLTFAWFNPATRHRWAAALFNSLFVACFGIIYAGLHLSGSFA